MNGLEISFKSYTSEKGDELVLAIISRSDGFVCKALGKTSAEALINASVLVYNRECQEFNAAECDKQEADKKNFSLPAEKKHHARRQPPVTLMNTDYLLDISMFISQMKIISKDMNRIVNDENTVQFESFIKGSLDGTKFRL